MPTTKTAVRNKVSKKRTSKKSAIKSGLTGERADMGFSIDELPFGLNISPHGKMTFVQKIGDCKKADATAGLAIQYLNLYYQKQILKQLVRINNGRQPR